MAIFSLQNSENSSAQHLQAHAPGQALEDPPLLTGVTQFEPLQNVKSILISGGAGFIGSWVTRHLALTYEKAYKIVCFDTLATVSSTKNIEGLRSMPNFFFVKGNIACEKDIQETLQKYDIDCVLHFAASSHVQDSFKDPIAFNQNNCTGTLVLLEAMRAHGKIDRFIHVSTDEVYGQTEGVTADENHALLPTNPYSASKAAAEMYVRAYQASYGIPTIVVRSNNVYGPHQYPEKIIPMFIQRTIDGQKLKIQGSGSNSRRYLYGADAADAFDTILHKGCIGSTYNIGSSYEVENIDVAIKILTLFGHDTTNSINKFVDWVEDRPFNDSDYNVDGRRLRELGWKQRTGFDLGLAMTVKWYWKFGSDWWETRPTLKLAAKIVDKLNET